LGENIDGLTQLANKLIDKEVVFGDDLEMIFGKRPWVKEEIEFPKEESKKDNETTSQQDNETISQQDNESTSQQDNESTSQQDNESTSQQDNE